MIIDPQLDESRVISIPRVEAPKEMISVTELSDGRFFVRANASSLQVIQECMRKAKYSLHEGWISRDENPSTIFGSSFHAALEVFYKGKFENRKIPQLKELELMAAGQVLDGESEDVCLSAFRAFLKKHEPISSLPAEDKRSAANGAWIFHSYLKEFINDPYVAYVDENGPFLERTFSLKIHEDEQFIVEIFGTIDFLFKNLNSDKLLPGDHKTSSSFGFGNSSYFDREKPNHQYSGYILGLNEVYGFSIEDFMVNVIEVKAKPKTAKAKGVSFPRQITTRTPEDLEEFKEVMIYYVKDYVRAIKTGMWPLGPVQSCASYGSCMYRQVCSSPKSLRETILRNKFERKV